MTGMALLVCCGWAVLLSLSVQAYENLALHQPAWQKSTWLSDTGAERAVDGQYKDLRGDGGQCAVSRYGQTAKWWVDLGGVKNIHHVYLQHATDILKSAFLGFSVYISNTTNKEDGVLCFRDINYFRATIPNPVNITCPYHGRYVIYYNNRTHRPYPEGYYNSTGIGLCEVEVYDCPSPGYYGKNCSLKCPQNCQDGYCDSVEGTCLACKPGFVGPRCDLECPAGVFGKDCVENCSMTCGDPGVCDKVTGHCNGRCLPGWEGNMCQNECSVGFYGLNCLQNCSMTCDLPGDCDRITGYCHGGCQRGWTGVMCDEECSVGSYGVNCLQNCSMNCGLPGDCDRITGYCHGGCQRGWTGVMCEEECPAGVFGKDCVENCSMTCGDPGVCDKVTGHCNGSCLAGWVGDMCQNECSVGFYGLNCLQNCSITCGLPGNCHRITGYCNGGCQRGWTGVMCEEGKRSINYKS